MNTISFVLFAYNEGHRLEYAIRNLKPYGEVLIFDGGSTDNTKEIAERFGARFIERPRQDTAHLETELMFKFVKQHTETSWIYWGYVDNLLPKGLLDKMAAMALEDRYEYVYVPVYTYLWGFIDHPFITASYPCFFKKEHMDFSGNRMHGMGKFTGSGDKIYHIPDQLEYAMRHYSLYDMAKFVQGHLRYAMAEAQEKFDSGKRFSLWYMGGSMGHYFYLFYKRGWRAGVKGLYVSLLYVFFRLMVAVRLYELEHNLTLETIEKGFVVGKEQLLKEIESGK